MGENHLRSSLVLPQVDRHTLLVPSQTPKPWTHAVDVELSPHAQWVTDRRRLDFDDLCTEMTVESQEGEQMNHPGFPSCDYYPRSCPQNGPAIN